MNNILSIVPVIKMSFSRKSHKTETCFGTVRLCGYRYAFGKMVKMYSVSNSLVMHNGGGYTLIGLVRKIMGK